MTRTNHEVYEDRSGSREKRFAYISLVLMNLDFCCELMMVTFGQA